MPAHREPTRETIEYLKQLLSQLNEACQQATELTANLITQMDERERANRPAKSNARTPERRRVKRKVR